MASVFLDQKEILFIDYLEKGKTIIARKNLFACNLCYFRRLLNIEFYKTQSQKISVNFH